MSSDSIKRIETLLSDRIGLNCSAVGSNMILRAVQLRMKERSLGSPEAYLALLAGSETELQSLIEEVVIPESWFFRDEMPFRLVQEYAQAGWVTDPTRPPLRILSIPCAGGEEPYSLVIALDEIGLADKRYLVDAVDISKQRLDLARRGIFRNNAFRGSDPQLRDCYFRKCALGFELDASLRDRVRFIQGSILDPGLLQAAPPYHVVFCRNLLIYLNEASRARVLVTLDHFLAEDGLLVVGHADRLNATDSEPRFTPIGARGSFAYRRVKTAGPPSVALGIGPSPRLSAASNPQAHFSRPEENRPGELQFGVWRASAALDSAASQPDLNGRIREFALPVQLAQPAGDDPDSRVTTPGLLLDRASTLVNEGRHQKAIELCQEALALQGPDAATYYLMGVVYQAAGNGALGETYFHKAVYLNPVHDEAMLALALVAERRGELAAAARLRRRAKRASSSKGAR
ncbi:MAG TPA: CheR family methyltransferase [Isosphaeraceae bacterium]|nr:CheR family methyltransferase [Isosphaeraceae bacterium]